MEEPKTTVHFADNYLINAVNPITVNLIGAGGTGSKTLTTLMEMNHSLNVLGHPGLQVRLWDDDIVTEANIGRQRFAECEIGLYKSVALINRVNRFMGTCWKAKPQKFERDIKGNLPSNASANIFISCVDTVQARFEIAEMLTTQLEKGSFYRDRTLYWLDFGNSQFTGQILLSTVGTIKQPSSKKYQTVENLPFVTEEFKELLRLSEENDNTPSCSLAEALNKQDLFINATLAQMGSSLLWSLFRQGKIENRGFFLNLASYHSQPIKIA